MSKITFTYDGTNYILEFDRDSANRTALNGLDVSKLSGEQIITGPKMIFEGALFKHHGRLSKRKVEEIFESFDEKTELIGALTEMYAQAVESVYSDGSGKTKWEVAGK